jgi:formylglycine-generating enzyme
MKRKLLSGIALLAMIITACNNPFFPEKFEKKLSPVIQDDVLVISVDGSDQSEVKCAEGEEITLTVNVDNEDNYTYQWYKNDENSAEGGTPIPGANDPSFKPPTDEEGTTYYYVEVVDKRSGKKSTSKPIKVTVDSEVPVISVGGSEIHEVECTEGEEPVLTAGVKGNEDDYTYQWYKNDENSNEDGTPIDGATGSTYKPPTDEEGTTYYYVVITNKNTGKKTTSRPIKVTVFKEPFIVTFNSNGGSSVTSISVTPTTEVSRPADPTRNGYVFDYWYQDSGLTTPYNFSTPVTANITLYAKWIFNTDISAMTAKDMVWIAGGTFTMGQPDISNATPVHSVTLNGFYMGKYQVTQEKYQTVMGSNPSNFSSNPATGETQNKRPVENVTWYDALVFCNKLSKNEGLSPAYSIKGSTDTAVWGTVPTDSNSDWNAVVIIAGSTGYRLPTEAQWEYACRAGTTTAYNTGDTISDDTGWYTNNSESKTHEVGKKPANAWGLYDMHGNVWERCWDWNGSYSSGAQTNPMGASSGTYCVIRGGGWFNSAEGLRSAYRSYDDLISRVPHLGFRLVRP